MGNPAHAVTRQKQATATEAVERQRTEPEEGRLLACALVAALLEYRRHLRCGGGEARAAEPAVEWRTLARWEQMVSPSRNGGR